MKPKASARRRRPYKLAQIVAAHDELRRRPDASRTELASRLGLSRVTVVREANAIRAGQRLTIPRCEKCGGRKLTNKCLRCILEQN